MRKMIALMMAFLTLSVHAATTVGNPQRLVNAFRSYQYDMTVVWDQQDGDFAELKLDQFKSVLEDLRADGMSNQDILNVVLDQFKNKNLKTEAQKLIEVLNTEGLNGDDAFELVYSQLSEAQTSGASWSTAQTIAMGVLIALSLLIVWASGPFHGRTY